MTCTIIKASPPPYPRQLQAGSPFSFKTCSKCGVDKPTSEFYRQASCVNGLRPQCKACHKACSAAYYQRHKTELRAQNTIYCQQHKEEIRARHAAYYQTAAGKRTTARASRKRDRLHPERSRAGLAVYYAIKRGELSPVHLSECVMCGGTARHRHHWAGYEPEHWLDVIPVCIPCHKAIHRQDSPASFYAHNSPDI